MSYSFDVAQGVVMKGWFRPDGGNYLTPLHEVVAPELHTLPGDIQIQLKRDFYKANAKASIGDGPIDWGVKHAAQDWLEKEVDEFRAEKLHKAFDESEIRDMSKRAARVCWRLRRSDYMHEFAERIGVDPPRLGRGITSSGQVGRMLSERWWRSQFRKRYTRRAESHLRAVGIVQKRRQLYASDRCVRYRRERKQRDSAMMQEMVAVSDAGDQLNLFDIVEKSQANPALRRAELMTRMRGFEEIAIATGHRARFYTLTCPSAFHRTHSSGAKNERWESFSPRDGQSWLCKQWARARAAFKRLGLKIYGFRVAEPHHDGTPHWHAVLFGARHVLVKVTEVLRSIWFKEYVHELDSPKAKTARFHVKAIIREKKTDGTYKSATGYIAKYIAKNIDGFEVGEDYEANNNQDAKQTCDRVAAWASVHGIRQFQQIGGPCVGLWRELRRLRDQVGIKEIEAARKAASDESDWAKFVSSIGGIAAGRNTQLTLWKEDDGELNQYGEPRAARVVGVQCVVVGLRADSSAVSSTSVDVALSNHNSDSPGVHRATVVCEAQSQRDCNRVRTRTKCWRIQKKASDSAVAVIPSNGSTVTALRNGRSSSSGSLSSLGPVSITVRSKHIDNPRLVRQWQSLDVFERPRLGIKARNSE